jgi:hypothetical protein
MTWDLSKLGNCAVHGRHTGALCPLCNSNHPVPASFPHPTPDEPEDDRSKWWTGPEKELHDLFATWLEHHEIEGIHGRTDQKATIESGWPDFTCLKTGEDGIPRVCMVEFKTRTGKLRKDQVEVIDRLRGRDLPVIVTGDFMEACDFVKAHVLADQNHDKTSS